MPDLDLLTRQVLENCLISDSRHAGSYSICGLALRLRDLYKWEIGLDPWVEREASALLAWIEEKERLWESVTGKGYDELTLSGKRFDPFDTDGINRELAPHDLFYGAGYVHGLKPSFFLAEREGRGSVHGHTVYMLGRELARDLVTIPALSQGDVILIRKASAKLFLWDKIFFVRRSGREALNFALLQWGVAPDDPAALRRNFDRIASDQLDLFVYHELGEMEDTVFDPALWREIVAAFPHTPVELFVRGVKDLLADTTASGTLRHFITGKKASAVGFYAAFQDGVPKLLFPEFEPAFHRFARSRNWDVIREAVEAGYRTGKTCAQTLSGIYRNGERRGDLKWAETEIHKRLLVPFGVAKGPAGSA